MNISFTQSFKPSQIKNLQSTFTTYSDDPVNWCKNEYFTNFTDNHQSTENVNRPNPYFVNQVHGTEIFHLTPTNYHYFLSTQKQEFIPEVADGVQILYNDWIRLPQEPKFIPPIMIKTADCLPIVIIGNAGHVLIHAGRVGIQKGILQSPKIQEIHPLYYFIGPSIRKCCYEIGLELIDAFQFVENINNKYFLDLQQESISQLKNLGLKKLGRKETICTCCHHCFHSYRRDKTKQRNFNVFDVSSHSFSNSK